MRGELERSHGGRALVGNDEQGHRATPLSGAQLFEVGDSSCRKDKGSVGLPCQCDQKVVAHLIVADLVE